MNTFYKIHYSVKTAYNKIGEFTLHQKVEDHSIDSVSNDLNEIFTDLFYKHRYEGIIGIEILSVEEETFPEASLNEAYEILSL